MQIFNRAHLPQIMNMNRALTTLENGGIVALPTDTVAGLAVDPFNAKAVKQLYEIKGRDEKKLLIWMIAELSKVESLVQIPLYGRPLIRRFWPGALTIIFNVANNSLNVTTLGVRIPGDQNLLHLLRAWNRPLGVTSANVSGEREKISVKEVKKKFGNKIQWYLDWESDKGGLPSTIVDVSGSKAKILREGRISKSTLSSVIGHDRLEN